MSEGNLRERLIIQGMEEIRLHGMQGFSLRRVASACGVSCAAPYKHFEDKQALFLAMVDYINEKWDERVRESFSFSQSVERTIAHYAVDYVKFLCDNPQFKSILMIKETGLDLPIATHAAGISIPLGRLFVIYRRKRSLTRAQLRERLFIVRSLMYGSTIIFGVDDGTREDKLDVLYAAVLKALS